MPPRDTLIALRMKSCLTLLPRTPRHRPVRQRRRPCLDGMKDERLSVFRATWADLRKFFECMISIYLYIYIISILSIQSYSDHGHGWCMMMRDTVSAKSQPSLAQPAQAAQAVAAGSAGPRFPDNVGCSDRKSWSAKETCVYLAHSTQLHNIGKGKAWQGSKQKFGDRTGFVMFPFCKDVASQLVAMGFSQDSLAKKWVSQPILRCFGHQTNYSQCLTPVSSISIHFHTFFHHIFHPFLSQFTFLSSFRFHLVSPPHTLWRTLQKRLLHNSPPWRRDHLHSHSLSVFVPARKSSDLGANSLTYLTCCTVFRQIWQVWQLSPLNGQLELERSQGGSGVDLEAHHADGEGEMGRRQGCSAHSSLHSSHYKKNGKKKQHKVNRHNV